MEKEKMQLVEDLIRFLKLLLIIVAICKSSMKLIVVIKPTCNTCKVFLPRPSASIVPHTIFVLLTTVIGVGWGWGWEVNLQTGPLPLLSHPSNKPPFHA